MTKIGGTLRFRRSACQKSILTSWWTGEYLPRHYHPLQFLLELQAIPVAKTAKKRFFFLKMNFLPEKSAPWSPYMPPITIKMREGCGPLALS